MTSYHYSQILSAPSRQMKAQILRHKRDLLLGKIKFSLYLLFTLTFNCQDYPLADRRGHTILGDAKVGTHLGSRDADEVENFAIDLLLF